LCFVLLLLPLRSTLFPYTTLFRSEGGDPLVEQRCSCVNINGSQVKGIHCKVIIGSNIQGLEDRDFLGGRLSRVAFCPDFCFQDRSEEHTSELQSRENLVCRLLLEK